RDALRPSLLSLPEEARLAARASLPTHLDPLLRACMPQDPVALFVSLPSEIDTGGLFERVHELGLWCALPRVTAAGLQFHLVDPQHPSLVEGRFGVREPRPDAPKIDIAQCRIIVVPGLAYDRDGYRLGYGKGYYDGALARSPSSRQSLRVGVCFDHQLRGVCLPREPWDIAVDMVCTPSSGLLRCGQPQAESAS
ncbi:MAG: 5-formyltetrahydrofolate cyclo-ligase, partial [Myxococcota bacterium]